MDERAVLQQKVEEEEAKLKLQQAAIEEAIKEKKDLLKKQKLKFTSQPKTLLTHLQLVILLMERNGELLMLLKMTISRSTEVSESY